MFPREANVVEVHALNNSKELAISNMRRQYFVCTTQKVHEDLLVALRKTPLFDHQSMVEKMIIP